MRNRNTDEGSLSWRALRKVWQVKDDKREELVRMLVDLALDDKVKARQRITAMKTLIMAETLDLKAIEVGIKAENHEDLIDRIEVLEERAHNLADKVGHHALPPRTSPFAYRSLPPPAAAEPEGSSSLADR